MAGELLNPVVLPGVQRPSVSPRAGQTSTANTTARMPIAHDNGEAIVDEEAAARFLRQLGPGETPMPGAPVVRLQDGSAFVPSQYLLFHHTVESVQALLDRIRYKESFLLFASADPDNPGQIYFQVGIIGRENYGPQGQERPKKIVYGRKWRVEEFSPTSELIQTALLALKSAEEHEARELFTYRGRTIFSNHFDLPLMRRWMKEQPDEPETVHTTTQSVQELIDNVRYDGYRLKAEDIVLRKNGSLVMDITFERDEAILYFNPGLAEKKITIVCEAVTGTSIMNSLMDAILHEVHREVEELFTFDGFARFSRTISIEHLRAFLRFHRDRGSLSFTSSAPDIFAASAAALNGAIDATRPPVLRTADIGVAHLLSAQEPLQGRKPIILSLGADGHGENGWDV